MPPTQTEAASTCRARKTTSTAKRYAMRARRPSGTIWHVPRLALLAIVVLAISPAATGAEPPTSRSLAPATSRWPPPAAAQPASSTRGSARRCGPHLARQPRGHARDGRLVEVRAEEHGLLRVPSAAVVLGRAQAGRLHDHEPREQPRPRLRGVGPGRDDRRAQAGRPSLHGPPGRDRRMRQGGTKVAFVGFAPYPWAQSLLDIEDAVKLVRRQIARRTSSS